MTRVLIVDDSLFMRNHLTKLLVKHGYETIAAEDGEQAVHTYRQNNPDVVLMDITMPRKDGLEALSEIRQLDPRAKVVMLTALNQRPAVTRAIQIGAKDFLVKPVLPDKLITALQKALR
jgi:two-component system chemotaxis response regulator CheY